MRGHLGYPAASTTGGEDAGWTSSWCGGMGGACSSPLGVLNPTAFRLPTGNPESQSDPKAQVDPAAGHPQLPEQTGNRAPQVLSPAPPQTQDILKGP